MKVFAFAAVLGAAVLCAAQDKKAKPYEPDGIFWALTYEEATAEAVARNVPIHFTVHKDN